MTISQNRNFRRVVRVSPLIIGCYLLGKAMKMAYDFKMRPPDSSRTLKMIAGAFYKPKESEKSPLGEDAYIVCDEAQTIGVADGVGSWAELGIDAGAYARELMDNVLTAIKNRRNEHVNPKEVLIEAHTKTKAEGSSTACIITLIDQCLHAVNVGDSGFIVLRDGKVFYQSPMRHHGFNYPFQLSNIENSDQPRAEEDLMVEVQSNDVVVAATDGLFDNMHEYEIAEVVRRGRSQGLTPTQLAWILGEIALYVATDENRITPFSENAKKAGYDLPGGKVDDITVVVAYILDTDTGTISE